MHLNRRFRYCANENGICRTRGKSLIKYGERGKYTYKVVHGTTSCTNKEFGDPNYGVVKKCWVVQIGRGRIHSNWSKWRKNSNKWRWRGWSRRPWRRNSWRNRGRWSSYKNNSGGKQFNQWIRCANEWGHCSFSGNAIVRYGKNGRYSFKEANNGISCTNNVFGDPNYGVFKECHYMYVNPGFRYCSNEWGTCHTSGRSLIKYGERGRYTYKVVNGTTRCTNWVFGDPNVGVFKKCWVLRLPGGGQNWGGWRRRSWNVRRRNHWRWRRRRHRWIRSGYVMRNNL